MVQSRPRILAYLKNDRLQLSGYTSLLLYFRGKLPILSLYDCRMYAMDGCAYIPCYLQKTDNGEVKAFHHSYVYIDIAIIDKYFTPYGGRQKYRVPVRAFLVPVLALQIHNGAHKCGIRWCAQRVAGERGQPQRGYSLIGKTAMLHIVVSGSSPDISIVQITQLVE